MVRALIIALLLACTLLIAPDVHADDGDDPVGEISFVLATEDADGGPITYSASLPDGASLNATTGEFSWTPTHDQLGIWVITFCASDGELSDCEDVTITVCAIIDVNEDLAVNVLDVIVVGQHFGEVGDPGWIRMDTNDDGSIDVLDIIAIAQGEWGDYGEYRW